MKKEFKLIDKRQDLRNCKSTFFVPIYFEEAVKEATQNLKKELEEELRHNVITCEINGVPLALKCVRTMCEKIDKAFEKNIGNLK